MSGNISGCHSGGQGDATGISWTQARVAVKHPSVQGNSPNKELSGMKCR